MRHKTQTTTVEKRKESLKKYNNSEARKQRMKEYYQENKDAWVEKSLQKLYGISLEDYRNLLSEQNNSCKICERPQSMFKRKFAVDHCHTTGKVRGLLCMNCNTSLGLMKENPNAVENMRNYIEDLCE